MMNEETLISKCINGNKIAQRQLFETYSPGMMGVCLRYFRDVEVAEDVLQESFVKVFIKLESYTGTGSLEGWIRKIVINTALDQLRKEVKFNVNVSVDDVEYKLGFDAQILSELMEEDLMKLVREMPDGYRTVFNLFAIEGFSHKEIGKQLGISENTSKSQYSRAKAYLKTRVEALKIGR